MKVSPVRRSLLWPISVLYGLAASIRTAFYSNGWLKQRRLKAAVISVGNLTVGGTGKTPMTIWLAEKLAAQNLRVAILTRGYKGADGTSDEVELMQSRLQSRVPIGVGKDRFAQGNRLESIQHIDVFLLDDGFQHLQLARDLDIVLIDASQPIAQPLLPAGPMRERVSAVNRADMIVFTRTESVTGARNPIQQLSTLPIYAASTVLLGFRRHGEDGLFTAPELGPGPFFAFSGIGNPDAFKSDLELWGIPLAGQKAFRDHHKYSDHDLHVIEEAAAKAGAKALITTEKDNWNLNLVTKSSMPTYVCVIDLQIDGASSLLSTIGALLRARGVIA